MKRFDLLEKMKVGSDYSVFSDEFELVNPNNMQQ